jgi:hypothetical protein
MWKDLTYSCLTRQKLSGFCSKNQRGTTYNKIYYALDNKTGPQMIDFWVSHIISVVSGEPHSVIRNV